MRQRLISLDVLRSSAILLVMTAHIILGYGAPKSLAPLQLGGIGVDLFFVLSGWLLGRQLFSEQIRTGNINIRRFWLRRWIRTLPAYYAVLALISLQQLITKPSWSMPLDYLVFLQNYNQPFEIFYVSWSLSVEEQFYFIIAPLLFFLMRFPVQLRLVALLIILMIPSIFRILGLYSNEYQTHVRIDGCIAGVLLAFISSQQPNIWEKLTKYSKPAFYVSLIFFFMYFLQRYYPMSWISEPGMLERSIMFSSWILFAVVYQKHLFWKIPGANYIATRSYALYLLHPEAIAVTNRLNLGLSFISYYLFVFFISILISEVLYRTIEIPFLNLRSRLAVAKSG